ncbi:MAG: hypothetical protein D6B27_12840 [Gammaproteobacteria bacterium]|nr:MAG: hypothetical protein D6B27_12840 [Gammaproteobacteria bacterium]
MNNLSKYKLEIMGISMLWIMFFHAQVLIVGPLLVVKAIGYIGADIFFLISGIGSIFSYSKSNSSSVFFGSRLRRLIPTFWICLLLFSISDAYLGSFNTTKFLLAFGGLDFLFCGDIKTWFIPAILVCYSVFLIHIKLADKIGNHKSLLGIAVIAILFSVSIINSSLSHLLIMTIRIPIFLLGVYIGNLILNNKDSEILNSVCMNIIVLIISMLALVVVFSFYSKGQAFYFATGIYWYPMILMVYPVTYFMGKLIAVFDKINIFRAAARLLGKHSLELYLIHTMIYMYADTLPFVQMEMNISRFPEYLIYGLITLLISIMLQKIVKTFFR